MGYAIYYLYSYCNVNATTYSVAMAVTKAKVIRRSTKVGEM